MKTNILKTTFLVLFSSLFLQVYGVCTPDVITPNVNINNGGWVSNGLPTLAAGGYIDFGPGPGPYEIAGTWSWTGPLSFTSTDRSFRLSNVQPNQSGDYIATFTNATTLCTSQYTFTLTVTGQCIPTVLTPNVQINNGAWVQSLNATLAAGGVVNFGPGPSWLTGSWSWTGPNGFTASGRGLQLTNVQPNQSGDYVVTYINEAGCSSQYTFNLTVTITTSVNSISSTIIDIYPNPAIDFINIKHAKGSNIAIFDSLGKLVMKSDCADDLKRIGVTSLLNGFYVIQAQKGKEIVTKSMVIIK